MISDAASVISGYLLKIKEVKTPSTWSPSKKSKILNGATHHDKDFLSTFMGGVTLEIHLINVKASYDFIMKVYEDDEISPTLTFVDFVKVFFKNEKHAKYNKWLNILK